MAPPEKKTGNATYLLPKLESESKIQIIFMTGEKGGLAPQSAVGCTPVPLFLNPPLISCFIATSQSPIKEQLIYSQAQNDFKLLTEIN